MEHIEAREFDMVRAQEGHWKRGRHDDVKMKNTCFSLFNLELKLLNGISLSKELQI
jgi:hypothetical protein